MRPPVSVVVPFMGDGEAARQTVAALARLVLVDGDEVLIADNDPERVQWSVPAPMTVVAAGGLASSFFARNRGAEAARNDWLLFMDADCVPPPGLLNSYFARPPSREVGILAGEVEGIAEQRGRLARWARSRRGLLASHHQDMGPYPAGVTGNLLVRKAAWEAVGGFLEAPRSAADLDFCFRAQTAGWKLLYMPAAVVGHRDPERLGPVLRQAFRYGTARRRLRKRHGVSVPALGVVRRVIRGTVGTVVWPLVAQPERGLFKLIDALVAIAMGIGYAFGGRRVRGKTELSTA